MLADVALATLGSQLKRRGKLTGRFADILSWTYLGFAVLRRFEAEGRRPEDLPSVHWAAQHSLQRLQEAFDGLYQNFDAPVIGWLWRGPLRWWARLSPLGTPPADRLGAEVAALLRRPGEQRERLTTGIYKAPQGALADLEQAFELAVASEGITDRIHKAIRQGRLPRAPIDSLLADAVAAGVIDADQRRLVERAAVARWRAIQVDDFSSDELRGHDSGNNDVETRRATAGAHTPARFILREF